MALTFINTYIETDNFAKMVRFYKALFQTEGEVYTENRWIEFPASNRLAVYNLAYDRDALEKDDSSNHFDTAYRHHFNGNRKSDGPLVINLTTDNLNHEYARLAELGLGPLSEIMFVNITAPYRFFVINDPDGNRIEIAEES